MENIETKNENTVYYIFKNGDIYQTTDCISFTKMDIEEYDYITGSIHTGFNDFESYKLWKSSDREIFEIKTGDEL